MRIGVTVHDDADIYRLSFCKTNTSSVNAMVAFPHCTKYLCHFVR